MPLKTWHVYLRGKRIDTVWFDADLDQDYVLKALIEHDHYDPSIKVKIRK